LLVIVIKIVQTHSSNGLPGGSRIWVEMAWILKWLVPQVRFADLPLMIASAAAGAVIAGAYGTVHDLVT